jgi:hypothetical protein
LFVSVLTFLELHSATVSFFCLCLFLVSVLTIGAVLGTTTTVSLSLSCLHSLSTGRLSAAAQNNHSLKRRSKDRRLFVSVRTFLELHWYNSISFQCFDSLSTGRLSAAAQNNHSLKRSSKGHRSFQYSRFWSCTKQQSLSFCLCLLF